MGYGFFFFFFSLSLSLSLSKLKIASPSCKGPSDALILGVDRCNDVDATMAFGDHALALIPLGSIQPWKNTYGGS